MNIVTNILPSVLCKLTTGGGGGGGPQSRLGAIKFIAT